MARAYITKELFCEMKNETALLGRITSALAIEGVSIIHLSAYSVKDKGFLQFIVKDPEKARKALKHFIPEIMERDVLVVEFENKTGTLAPVCKVLGNHAVFIDYVYGTSSDGFKIIGVFSTSDNEKAMRVINEECGSMASSA